DEHDEVLRVARVRDLARRRGLDVQEPSRPEDSLLALHLDVRLPRVDEVELVLGVVEVVEPLVSGWHHDGVHAERTDPQRPAHLAKAVSLAELVDRPERIAGHHFSFPSRSQLAVRRRPSSRSICGSKPSWLRAALTSAHELRRSPARGARYW